MNAAEIKGRKLTSARTTKELVISFELTEVMELTEEVAIARGWIMDELKARDPEAFDAWMDDEDFEASPRKYFVA